MPNITIPTSLQRFIKPTICGVFALILTGCGLRGDLYLPPKEAPTTQQATSPTPSEVIEEVPLIAD